MNIYFRLAGLSLGSSMLTPHFGHPQGFLLKIVVALVMRLVPQRGQRNPKPNTAKTDASSNDITLTRNV
jgi:hypothetical protein